jgi:parallel beta-helix repeat protein
MLLLSVLILFPFSLTTKAAPDVYVDDDQAPGWYDATHVKTIQEGIDNASANQTVYVYNGTYQETIWINKSIRLVGESNQSTVITNVGATDKQITIQANNTLIDNLRLFGGQYSIYSVIDYTDNITISNCIFENNTLIGIYLSDNLNATVNNNRFYNASDYNVCYYLSLALPQIYTCNAYDNYISGGQTGFYIASNSATSYIFNNIITSLTGSPTSNGIAAIAKTAYVYNNYISDITGYGINTATLGITSGNISNNTITNVSRSGVYLRYTRNLDISNNVITDSISTGYFPAICLAGTSAVNDCSNNTISNNTITNCVYGLSWMNWCNNNTYIYNTLTNCSVAFRQVSAPDYETFYLNNFINCTSYWDNRTNNKWNSTTHGNYWSNYDESSEGAWDNNTDGIADTPYTIPGTAGSQDFYPLMFQGGGLPNSLGFDPASQHVTIHDIIDIDIYADIRSFITTVAVDNLTYLPAGVINYTSTTSGDLFTGTTLYGEPETDGEIHNDTGWCKYFLWGHTIGANNKNATAFDTDWLAVGVGTATLNITAGGTATNGTDPGTTKNLGYVYVHPKYPTGFIATAYNGTQINLTWTTNPPVHADGVDAVVIYANDTASPTSRNPADEIYNGTGTSHVDSGLSPSQTRYYTAWTWNETADMYSLLFQQDDATTNAKTVFSNENPTNGTTGTTLAFNWTITIEDPDGDTFNWEIECSNGQTNSDTADTNGTKQLSLSGLSYGTTYTVWVNATDNGTGQTTSEWFTFMTVHNQPPDVPFNPTPPDSETNVDININQLTVRVRDPEGHSMDVDFYWGNGTLIGTDTTVASGGTAQIAIPRLSEVTTYYWYVNATDIIGNWTLGPAGAPATNWSFTTKRIPPSPGAPEKNELEVLVVSGITPLGGATVVVSRGTTPAAIGPQVAIATTLDDGTYKFLLDDGRYILTVSYPGLETQNIPLEIRQDTSYVVYMIAIEPEYGGIGIIILSIGLLLLGLFIAFLTVKQYIAGLTGILICALVNIITIVIGVIYFYGFVAVGIILLFLEYLWIKR